MANFMSLSAHENTYDIFRRCGISDADILDRLDFIDTRSSNILAK